MPSSNDILSVLIHILNEVIEALLAIGTILLESLVHIYEGVEVDDRPVLELVRRRVFVSITHLSTTRSHTLVHLSRGQGALFLKTFLVPVFDPVIFDLGGEIRIKII